MYRQEKDTGYFNRSTSKLVWKDLKEITRSFQSQFNSIEGHLGNVERRLNEREVSMKRVYTMGIFDIKNIIKRIHSTNLDKVGGREMKWWGRDFREGHESYGGAKYSYMNDGYEHWSADEQELDIMERKPMNLKRRWSSYEVKFANNIANVSSPLARESERSKTW